MAGTIFGLPLSQRVDLNGLPSVGWLLYLYTANTSTPVNSYQDTALTVLNAWPLAADSTGMLPQFWLADGSYRARATNADGSITYFDQPSILALGASSGAAPSGGVDANAIFQTGDVMWLDRSGTKTGWVRDNGRTIGSGTSGADERANADCQALFQYLWNNFNDEKCPVITGRGGSALIDWTANKKITLPDKRGCSAIGADAMGGAASSRLSDTPWQIGNSDEPGSVVGENTHGLSEDELAEHVHFGTGTTGGQSNSHTHNFQGSGNLNYQAGGTGPSLNSSNTGTTGNASADHTHGFGFTTEVAGGGQDHNTVHLSIIGTFYRKL